MELLAVWIGVKAIKFVRTECQLTIQKTILWTDSKCTLDWIASSKLLPKFVENSVNEIRKFSHTEFYHIAGKENPTDIPTQGCSLAQVEENEIWQEGPSWL